MPRGTIRSKSAILTLWGCLILIALSVWRSSGIAPAEAPVLLREWLEDFGLLKAAGVYMVLYTIRPILLFPGMWLSIASGLVFGPWLGVFFTLIGANFSAVVAFLIARHLGRDWVQSKETGVVKKWDSRLRENGILTVMILRLLYLPYDGVSYGCGLTSMNLGDFAVGTFIGILPGTIMFVLLGGAVSPHAGGTVAILGVEMPRRIFVLSLSLFFFALGLAIATFIHRSVPGAGDEGGRG